MNQEQLMKFTLHQMEMERKAALKKKKQSSNFFARLFQTIIGRKLNVLMKEGVKND